MTLFLKTKAYIFCEAIINININIVFASLLEIISSDLVSFSSKSRLVIILFRVVETSTGGDEEGGDFSAAVVEMAVDF